MSSLSLQGVKINVEVRLHSGSFASFKQRTCIYSVDENVRRGYISEFLSWSCCYYETNS